MRQAVPAAALYFALVFAAGFVLGALRVTVLVPQVGALAAVAMELPLMIALSWLAAGWVLRRIPVGTAAGRAAMGGIALGLLMAAELVLTVALGGTASGFLAGLGTPVGALGLAGQVVFAAIPFVRARYN